MYYNYEREGEERRQIYERWLDYGLGRCCSLECFYKAQSILKALNEHPDFFQDANGRFGEDTSTVSFKAHGVPIWIDVYSEWPDKHIELLIDDCRGFETRMRLDYNSLPEEIESLIEKIVVTHKEVHKRSD